MPGQLLFRRHRVLQRRDYRDLDDQPDNGNLSVVTVDISGKAIVRAWKRPVFIDARVILLADRETHAVLRGKVIVKAPKKSKIRVGSWQNRGEVVAESSRGARIGRRV